MLLLCPKGDDNVIKESKYVNGIASKISIDPSDEGIVIVSNDECTRIWVKGKEILCGTNAVFTHKAGECPRLELKIEP